MWLNIDLPLKITKTRTNPVLFSHPKKNLKQVFLFNSEPLSFDD